MKSDGEIREMLNAYDLAGSYRAAAELCGCSHHTVAKAVADRDRGLTPVVRRAQLIDDFHRSAGGLDCRVEGQDPRRQGL